MPGSPDSIPRLHILLSEQETTARRRVRIATGLLREVPSLAVHLRARIVARDLYLLARDLAAVAAAAGNWCVVNGRPDVALAACAQAVQLGHAALGVSDVRDLVRDAGTLRLGASIHAAREGARAAAEGADYLVAGTIFRTPSHPGEAAGPGRIREVRDALPAAHRVPVLAIGGVTADRVRAVARAGAHGVVVGRAVWEATDPEAAARALAAELGALPEAW